MQNDAIEVEESDYLYTQVSQIAKSGNGLFTAIDIYKEEVVATFKGKILSDKQAQSKVDKGQDRYFIAMLDGSIMDSMKAKCFAKFANDAKGAAVSEFKNNTKITIDEADNVCLVATKNIKAGSEVFCAYGKAYWDKHCN
jgi:uncharacterized protein